MIRKVLVSVTERLLAQIDLLAEYRSQSRSELVREALRTHLERARNAGAPLVAQPLSLMPALPCESFN